MAQQFSSTADYINSFSGIQKELLQQIRNEIHLAAPNAQETISYGMPAFKLKGKPLVYFAAYKNHIGFYATPTGHTAFQQELSNYKQGKGSVQFPIDKPLPLSLIARIVAFRISQV